MREPMPVSESVINQMPDDAAARAATTSAVPVSVSTGGHGRRLASWLGLAAAAVLGFGLSMCTTSTVVPGQDPTTLGLCTFSSACYLVQASGPNEGQCADCTGGPAACRLVFTLTDPNVVDPTGSGQNGTWSRPYVDKKLPPPYEPLASDPAVVCSSYNGPAATGEIARCRTPEQVCFARGPECDIKTSHCARAGQSCQGGTPWAPQRRGAGKSYCPYTDDVCCPGPMPMPDMGTGDGGTGDGGTGDGGASDGGGTTDGGTTDAGLVG